jgi:acetolactate synthase-1/2/3 large subunit/5-guanidino-2-oxopentanoate decarboxylase
MQRPLGAQISHMLKDRGVEVIFGIPGVHNQELYRGIEEAGLTHILARHEQGAGFMADGYARATGKPGVCYVITGPGLTNIMTPMGQAYSDSVPMLVISSCLDETAATRGQLHQMRDQRAAAATVCDWSEEARTAQAAYQLIDRALVEFETQRRRPKHVSVPIAVLEGLAGSFEGSDFSMDSLSGLDDSNAKDLVDHLSEARRPILVFGGGCHSHQSYVPDEVYVRDLMKRTGAAAFTTYAGRGLIPPDHPMYFGSNLARPSSADVFAEADLVVVFGSELSEGDLWRASLGHSCPLVRVDLDEEVLAQNVNAKAYHRCDAISFIIALNEALPEETAPKWDADFVAAARRKWRAEVDAERPGIVPVADALCDCLPEGTMIYSDMTQFAYAAKEVWDMDFAGHWHHPTGFGTLGYALPAAIGGAVGRNGLPTLAIAGDYGFQYTLQELATAVELGLSLPIFLWDNNKLGEIEDSMVRAQIAPNAVTLRNPDFSKLAEAYGAHSAQPTTLSDMQDAVKAAFAADVPTLIHVASDIAL